MKSYGAAHLGSLRQRELSLSLPSRRIAAFTLIEVLGVVVIIAILAVIGLQVNSYVQRMNSANVTRAQIAAIEMALEAYRADFGYYPVTTPVRLSASYLGEATNNWYLHRALFAQGKQYLRNFPPGQVRLNVGTCPPGQVGCQQLTNLFDVYGMPFNYYNSPGTTYGLSNNIQIPPNINAGYTVGGQTNLATYDLFSYGPDKVTFADPSATAQDTPGTVPWNRIGWRQQSSQIDDITNWGRR